MAEKILKIKSSTLNVANLAMIFKLDPRQGIYIHSDEGEIILPDSMGSFKVDDQEKTYTYLVNGEPVTALIPVSRTPTGQSLGIPQKRHTFRS